MMITVALIQKDFANRHMNKTFSMDLPKVVELRRNGGIIVRSHEYRYDGPQDVSQHELYKVEYGPLSYYGSPATLKIIEMITLDSNWDDIDDKTEIISFLIYKYYDDDSEIVSKVIEKAKKHRVANYVAINGICYALANVCYRRNEIDEIFKTHMKNLFKSSPKRHHQSIVTMLIRGIPPDLIDDLTDIILETTENPNAYVVVLDYLCKMDNTETRDRFVPTLVNKIMEDADELTSYSLIKLADCCKYFVNAQDIIDKICIQVFKRFRHNCRLLYKIATSTVTNVDKLFDYICRTDKSGKYVILMLEKFPWLDKKRAISIVSRRENGKHIEKVIRRRYMLTVDDSE